jgi:hypothetical protein
MLGIECARVLWRVDTGREVGEVSRTVSELVLDGERCKSTETAARLVGLFEALGEQSSLECERVERRERGWYLAGARAGEVGKR